MISHDPGNAVEDGLKLTISDLRHGCKDSVATVQARYDEGMSMGRSSFVR